MTSGDGVKLICKRGLWYLKELGGAAAKQHQVEHWKTIFKKKLFGNFKGGGQD